MSAGTSASAPPRSAELRVGGLVPLSTCDWPGQLAATLFCQGCPWDCPYCHNPHLREIRAGETLVWRDLMTWLESRRGLLDGVVFSGGEPTLQAALPDAVREVRRLGFRIGLHTAGPYPKRLATLLPWLDWVGFDVKARSTITPGSPTSPEAAPGQSRACAISSPVASLTRCARPYIRRCSAETTCSASPSNSPPWASRVTRCSDSGRPAAAPALCHPCTPRRSWPCRRSAEPISTSSPSAERDHPGQV